jgi:hypothetical protein
MEGNMYQKILISVMAFIVLMSFSCKKDGASRSSSANPSYVENGESATTIPRAGSIGYALRVSTSFYTLETDTDEESDKTKWTAAITLGDKVTVGKARRLTFAGDGKVYDFVEIRRDDGKDGYAFATQIATDCTLAVVVDEKANLYKTAKTNDVTGDIISRKTVVAMLSGTESGNFVEIKAYDPIAERTRQNFVRLNSLSRKDSDIQSSILLQLAEPLKNTGSDKVRRDALLEAAMFDYPDSAFYAEIQALVNPNTAVSISTESAVNEFMTVIDDHVNVRGLPDSLAGRVIGQVARGIVVTVSEQTTDTSTVDGQTARWYHITEPLDGWIFGTFLE